MEILKIGLGFWQIKKKEKKLRRIIIDKRICKK